MDAGLSPYVKKKMMQPYMQGDFKEPREFARFLKKHGIEGVNEKELESFEREGWLQPAFRLVLPEQNRRGDIYLGLEVIQQFHKEGFVELPQPGDFEPWSNFKSAPKSLKRDKKLLFYHPFQLFQVKNILSFKKISFLYFDSHAKSDLEKITSNIETNMQSYDSLFKSLQLDITKKIGILMLLEEPYSVYVYNRISIPITIHIERFGKMWWEWRKRYTAGNLLSYIGVSKKQIRHTRDWFVKEVGFLDPLKEWYDIIRIMRPHVVEQIEGDAYTAQLYYTAARMLTIFLHELNGRTGAPAMPFDDTNAKWKKYRYTNQFDYGTHETREAIIRYFVRDTSTRLYLLVEGETEEAIIKKICERRGINLDDNIVRIINKKGVGNMAVGKNEFLLQSANIDSIAIYLIADNEKDWGEEIRAIRTLFHGKFKRRIWRTSFEEDNFGRKSVIDLINSYLEEHDQKLSYREVKQQQRHKKGLVAAIESAYRIKYKDDLLRFIRKTKKGIAQELMESISQKNNPNGKAKELKIEKALNKAFGMVRVWR